MSISVLMSVYNAEKPEFLAESLESLKQQTLVADQVVLVEDGPVSVELKAVIESYRKHLNICSVRLPENVGLAAALNAGLQHCQHELIARMDTDDIAQPQRFAVQYQFMREHREIAACSSYVEEFFEGRNLTPTVRILPTAHEQIVRYAKFRTPLSHPAAIYRKTCMEAIGGYPLLYPEDQALWALMISRGYKLGNIPEVLLRMRTSSSFFHRRGWYLFKGQLKVLNFRRRLAVVSNWEYTQNFVFLCLIRLPPRQIRSFLFNLSRQLQG